MTLFKKIKSVFYPVHPLMKIATPAFDKLEARDKKKKKQIMSQRTSPFLDRLELRMRKNPNPLILLFYELYGERVISRIRLVKWHFDMLCTAIRRSKELGGWKGLDFLKKALVAIPRLYKILKALDSKKDRKG